jgi:hypothetical protein
MTGEKAKFGAMSAINYSKPCIALSIISRKIAYKISDK